MDYDFRHKVEYDVDLVGEANHYHNHNLVDEANYYYNCKIKLNSRIKSL
jgi:hypothetical protein